MTLHYEIDGPDGAPVLLMGGSLGTDLTMWDAQLPLADAFRLVRFDHRGHGGSPVPAGPYEIADLARDVLELMDEQELERGAYCGLSIGGMVGMWLGAHAPERIERLILICTSAYMPPASKWRERAEAVRAAGSTAPIVDAVTAGWLTPDFVPVHPQSRERLRAMLLAAPVEGYAECCGAIERMDLRAELPRISIPTLVVSARDDPATPPPNQVEIAEAIPGARLETVAPAAHISVVEQPAAINRLIREHLR